MSKFIEVTDGDGEKFILNTMQIESVWQCPESQAKRYAEVRSLGVVPKTIIGMAPRLDTEPTCYVVETYDQIKVMLM